MTPAAKAKSKRRREVLLPSEPLKEVDWVDEEGRIWRTLIPQSVSDSEAQRGVPIGPPSLEDLELPLTLEVRLHNQLHARRLFTIKDVKARRRDVVGALLAVFKIDAQRIVGLYLPDGKKEGS